MSVYPVTEIDPRNERDMTAVDRLLADEGLRRDRHLDFICGMYDDGGSLIATGSLYRATLRCMAVSGAHRGEGLLNSVISFLTEKAVSSGYSHLFVCTKYDTALFFKDVGFYEIATVRDTISFLENKRGAFFAYLDALEEAAARKTGANIGDSGTSVPDRQSAECTGIISAIVMNANPFTLGHQFLVEQASRESSLVHLFLVSEDESVFPFSVRKKLVTEGTKHLENVILHDSGPYMISNATFPSYFQKDDAAVTRSHAAIDAAVFLKIAQRLKITRRYVGEEPFSETTNLYNEVLGTMLPEAGVALAVVPRKTVQGREISASGVRALIREDTFAPGGSAPVAHDGNGEEADAAHLSDACRKTLAHLVPPATLAFLASEEGRRVIAAVKEQHDVNHH